MRDFKNKIVYEVYIKSFMDTTGDGCGDIKGVISKLDYIKSLGITTIWITPFYLSPMKDEGYDVADYYKVNKSMGNMQDIDNLLQKCKELDLEVMLDFVLNHTSSEHEWFKKALSGDKKYQDYYFFYDKPMTNWISRFGDGGVWEYVKEIDKYYLHLYDKTQPDLNWDNPNVRKEMANVVEFWLKKEVVAYKFDVLYLISKPTHDWEPSGEIPSAIACRDGKNVHKYIKELMKIIKTKFPNTYSVGEMSFSSKEESIIYSNPKNKEIDIVMTGMIAKGTPVNSSDSILRSDEVDNKIYLQTLKEWSELMNDNNGWLSIFTANHDSPRTVNRFGDVKYRNISAKAHMVNVAFLRGTPFFHQGQELAMLNPNYENITDYVDIKSINIAKKYSEKIPENDLIKFIDKNGRDSGRNPMIWNKEKNGGWSVADNPWRKTNESYVPSTAVSIQETNEKSPLNFFKQVIAIRKKSEILSYGSIKFYDYDPYTFVYIREFKEKKILVIINVESKRKTIDIESFKTKEIIINNYSNVSIKNGILNLKEWQSLAFFL